MKDNPADTVQSIAEVSGFISQTTFIRAFKNVFGKTPTEYRFALHLTSAAKKAL